MLVTLTRLALLFIFTANVFAQKAPEGNAPAEAFSIWIAKHLTPSVVVIKAGSNGIVAKQGTGIVIRADGIILTAYHVIKDSKQVQVVTKDGETYDSIEVLGIDERRDVVALRIPVQGLSPVAIRTVSDEQIGARVFAISNPQNMNWTISDGLLSGMRLADDVPGTGKGFKLLQFTAPVSSGSSGGLLVDVEGRGIGLIVGGLHGQSLNFAVPLNVVAGLADQTSKGLLAGGLALGESKKEPEKIEERQGRAVAVAEASRVQRIREARLLYVERRTSLCKPVMLQNALLKYATQLDEWNVKLVDELSVADIVVEIDNMPMTFFYTYKITDKRAHVVLGAGRVTAWDCNLAAPGLSKQIVQTIRGVYEPPKLPKQKEVEKPKAK